MRGAGVGFGTRGRLRRLRAFIYFSAGPWENFMGVGKKSPGVDRGKILAPWENLCTVGKFFVCLFVYKKIFVYL